MGAMAGTPAAPPAGVPESACFPSASQLAATTITGDALCKATNVTYRLDTEAARSFLRAFVILP